MDLHVSFDALAAKVAEVSETQDRLQEQIIAQRRVLEAHATAEKSVSSEAAELASAAFPAAASAPKQESSGGAGAAGAFSSTEDLSLVELYSMMEGVANYA